MYPEDSVQSSIMPDPWWEENKDPEVDRGDLIWVHVPYINQQPFRLVPTGRSSSTEHNTAQYKVEPHDATRRPPPSQLPVAGLPTNEGELFYAYRAKDRPAVVASTGGDALSKELRTGTARWRTSSTILIIPASRTIGFKTEFVDRVRRCEWPQYMWDKIPGTDMPDSIFLMGQLQPIGSDFKSFRKAGYRLGKIALEILDDWLGWLITNTLEESGILNECREEFLKL